MEKTSLLIILLSNELRFPNCFAVSREGMRGGLAMLWSFEVKIKIKIKSYSCHHVDVVVLSEKGSYWRCTGIYGHLELAHKQHTWNLLKRLAIISSLPWLSFEDFNENLNLNENIEGNEKQASMITDFKKALKEYD